MTLVRQLGEKYFNSRRKIFATNTIESTQVRQNLNQRKICALSYLDIHQNKYNRQCPKIFFAISSSIFFLSKNHITRTKYCYTSPRNCPMYKHSSLHCTNHEKNDFSLSRLWCFIYTILWSIFVSILSIRNCFMHYLNITIFIIVLKFDNA